MSACRSGPFSISQFQEILKDCIVVQSDCVQFVHSLVLILNMLLILVAVLRNTFCMQLWSCVIADWVRIRHCVMPTSRHPNLYWSGLQVRRATWTVLIADMRWWWCSFEEDILHVVVKWRGCRLSVQLLMWHGVMPGPRHLYLYLHCNGFQVQRSWKSRCCRLSMQHLKWHGVMPGQCIYTCTCIVMDFKCRGAAWTVSIAHLRWWWWSWWLWWLIVLEAMHLDSAELQTKHSADSFRRAIWRPLFSITWKLLWSLAQKRLICWDLFFGQHVFSIPLHIG